MRAPGAAVAALAVALAAGIGADAGAATLTLHPCQPGRRVECGRLRVPLDRSGAVSGTISLAIRRIRAPGAVHRGAVIALAGGPGQAAIPFADQFATQLRAFAGRRDVVVLDQRGTGGSGLLRCRGLEAAFASSAASAVVSRQVGACAATLGPARAHYTSLDSVEDIDDVRRALGLTRIALYGVSYGTKVAAGYAIRHPANVSSLVLDSVVQPEGPDAFDRSTFAAVPRVLRALCRGAVDCHASADLGRLTPRLRSRPLRGSVFDAGGRPQPARLEQGDLLELLVAGDLDPLLRTDLPAALHAARAGDAAPLLRMLAVARSQSDPPAALSPALYTATTCEELGLPWPRTTPIAGRPALAAAALAAIPAAAFAPFDARTALESDAIELCEPWPQAPDAPAFGASRALPDVPVLVLSGLADLRTPLADARSVVARLPRGQLLEVPGVGHSVLGSDPTGCAARALATFGAGRAVRPCAGTAPVAPRADFPRSVATLPPYPGSSGSTGRTLYATLLTLFDASDYSASGGQRGGGLRGGSYRLSATRLALRGMVLIPGVVVSGTFPLRGTARFRVSGAAARPGTVQIMPDGTIDARLGGRHIVIGPVQATAAGPGGGRRHPRFPADPVPRRPA